MQSFRTEINIQPTTTNISHQHQLLLMGSCFSENMGLKLQQSKFRAIQNPFGIIYNPYSIASSLERLIQSQPYTEEELFYHNERWQCFDHHGHFADMDKNGCLEKINKPFNEVQQQLPAVDFLLLTFGSAVVYRNIQSGKIVANCHKVPNNEFRKEILEIDALKKQYEALIAMLKTINPGIKIVLTVSPVRYIKESAFENSISKSTLFLLVKHLVDTFENAQYFPAYEMVIDDLRDYRFYAEDMVHPNQQAIEYIWKKFSVAYFNETTQQLMRSIARIAAAANHRPFNLESEAHQQFISKTLLEIEKLENESGLDFFEEKSKITSNNRT